MLENASDPRSSNAVAPSRSLPLSGTFIRSETETTDVLRLLEELEELHESAKRLPFGVLAGFDSERFQYIVLKVRANLPEAVKHAARVSRDSDEIVARAREQAAECLAAAREEAERMLLRAREQEQAILQAAEARAHEMVAESHIVRMAHQQAFEIVREAERKALEQREGADEYARVVLRNLEGVMDRAIVTVRQGREELERG